VIILPRQNETERIEYIRKIVSLLSGPFLGYSLLNLLFVFQATIVRDFNIIVWISAIIICNGILVVLFHPLSILLCSWIYLWASLLLLCHYKQKKWSENVRTIINVIFIIIGLVPILVALFVEEYRVAFLFLWTIPLWFISFNYTFYTLRIAKKQHSNSQVNWLWVFWVMFLTLVFLVNPVMFMVTL
jgi:hypothetical protein